MSKNAHTAGPWHVVDQFDDMEIFVSSIHGQVATCEEHRGIWKESAKANARLIALSPEMLELLRDALPCVEESEQFNKPSRRGLSAKIRAAIAKATA